MAINTLQNSTALSQQKTIKEDRKVRQESFRRYLDSLIRENCTYNNDSYSLFVCDLEHSDKKLFLTYLTSIEEYEYLTANPTRERIALREYHDHMQTQIDDRIDDIYHEDMEDMANHLNF